MHIDVFNGDADGMYAMLQIRLVEPQPDAVIVTGLKRDIDLVRRVKAREGDHVTVCDISLARNRTAVKRVLEAGAFVTYFDHHDPGEGVQHEQFAAHIDTRGEICTSVIVDGVLGGAQSGWAVVGAFGDNMNALALKLAEGRGLPVKRLRELGNLLNYNGYGGSLDDLHFDPEMLFRRLLPFSDPVAFLEADETVMPTLREGLRSDLAAVGESEVLLDTDTHFAVRLPKAKSSRRIAGLLGNRLATAHPNRAHAVLVDRGDVSGVSLRAPISTRCGALDLAKTFGGGGREAAAGIDSLANNDVPDFIDAFRAAFA